MFRQFVKLFDLVIHCVTILGDLGSIIDFFIWECVVFRSLFFSLQQVLEPI